MKASSESGLWATVMRISLQCTTQGRRARGADGQRPASTKPRDEVRLDRGESGYFGGLTTTRLLQAALAFALLVDLRLALLGEALFLARATSHWRSIWMPMIAIALTGMVGDLKACGVTWSIMSRCVGAPTGPDRSSSSPGLKSGSAGISPWTST